MIVFAVLGVGLAVRNEHDDRDEQIAQVGELAADAGLNADRFLNDRLEILTAVRDARVLSLARSR
jgi:hypothetical protein